MSSISEPDMHHRHHQTAGSPTPSPGEIYGDDPDGRPALVPHISAPAGQTWQSPIRQHKRSPSHHREVKETLNARSQYMNDDEDGRSQLKINQYHIQDEIGRGSYGAVHLATDQFGNEYAVKEFSKTRLRKRAQSNILRHGPRRPARFPPGIGLNHAPHTARGRPEDKAHSDALYLIREEIAIMKKLNHPNLVQLIEVLDDPEQDSLYMVLEMCKKGVIMQVGLGEGADPYDEEQCRYWFRDLILGIEYLHAQGVVHRDIKPDNLLLTKDDILKIVDFGVSEMFEKPDEMRTAKSAGSPAFLPPELCVARHGDVAGKACDIWSMGVSLYCLRYGKIPFEHETVPDMYDAIKNHDVELPDGEDKDLVDLMRKILEKDPEKRIKMEELREHPWVTKGGTDELLSADENCSELVEPPNDLEVSHAFTQKMSHLLCVMKAISKFKSLIHSRANTPKKDLLSPYEVSKQDPDRTPRASMSGGPKPELSEEDHDHAAHATALVKQRIEFLRKQSSQTEEGSEHGHGHKGHAHDPTDAKPTFLHIGTGGHSDFQTPGASAEETVSESPTAVEFNVYDRAYEAEIKRIRSQRRRQPNKMYLTRHLQQRDQYREDGDVVEGRAGGSEKQQQQQQQQQQPPQEPGGVMPKVTPDDADIGPAKVVSRSYRFAEAVTGDKGGGADE